MSHTGKKSQQFDLCPVCGSLETKELFSWQKVPVNIGILWPSREDAVNCNKGDLQIIFCDKCGHTWNSAFDPDRLDYSQAYDNNLHYSPTYNQYALRTAQRLIDQYQLHGKKVLEIGCGKGDFLIMLCTLADNKGVGFDTSFETRDLDSSLSDRLSIVKDFYSEKYAGYEGNLVASRYVLEHIENPAMFLNMVRGNIADRNDTVVYFEVPDVYLIMEQLSVWDFIYEHVSYFSPGSLATLFEKCGFRILDLYETYSGQFIGIEAEPIIGEPAETFDSSSDLERIIQCSKSFLSRVEEKRKSFLTLLQKIRDDNLRVLVWGAGAKGVSYLNMLGIQNEIPYVVDINPNKQGKYIAGTGQKIVSPEFSIEFAPHLVIVMNPIYVEEIRHTLSELGVQAEILTI